MKHMKSRYIRTSETSETPMTAMCRDMMLKKFNLFLGHHDMMDDAEKTQRINATNLQLKMKDLRRQTVRMVQVWNRFEPPRKQACVFQICIVYHVLLRGPLSYIGLQFNIYLIVYRL